MEREKATGKKGLRTARFNIRLTEEEVKIFREKAEKYPNLTALVVDAVTQFDIRKGRNRIDTMIKFSEDVMKFDAEIARIGNNINQMARAMNQYKMERIDLENVSFDAFLKEIEEAVELVNTLLREVRIVANR